MPRNQRLALCGIAVAIAVAAFVILSPGSNDKKNTSTTGKTAQAATSPTRIEVRNGKPVGGIHEIKLKKGDTIRLRVSSPDTTSEVHMHGYDVMRDLKPGKPASFAVPAKIEGVFEVELEDTSTQIAKLTVEPS